MTVTALPALPCNMSALENKSCFCFGAKNEQWLSEDRKKSIFRKGLHICCPRKVFRFFTGTFIMSRIFGEALEDTNYLIAFKKPGYFF
jgi:hypothetical protein